MLEPYVVEIHGAGSFESAARYRAGAFAVEPGTSNLVLALLKGDHIPSHGSIMVRISSIDSSGTIGAPSEWAALA